MAVSSLPKTFHMEIKCIQGNLVYPIQLGTRIDTTLLTKPFVCKTLSGPSISMGPTYYRGCYVSGCYLSN